jgi:hypothetical protein
MLHNEFDLLPRAFDVSVFSVPFALPSDRVAAASAASAYPVNSLVTGLTGAGSAWSSVTNEALRWRSEPMDANTDMGIAGGLGSGSSIGSRARTLPTSKYRDAASAVPEGGAPVIFRSFSADSAPRSALPLSASDVADIVRDLAVLDQTPGWEEQLLSRLPGLQPGLDPVSPLSNSDGWLLDCPFSRLMAGESGPISTTLEPGTVCVPFCCRYVHLMMLSDCAYAHKLQTPPPPPCRKWMMRPS